MRARRLVFVGGKGGVGKTTVAAALATHMADGGRRCLLVSTDPAHSLGDLFATEIGPRERALAPNLSALEIDPDGEADRYLESVKRNMRELVRPEMYHEIDRQMELARASPGAIEAAMLERVASLMIAAMGAYDAVVFDTAPTGQTLRLLSLPEIMAAWTEGLLRHRDRSDAMGSALRRLRKAPAGDELSYIDQARDEHAEDDRFRRVRATLVERQRTFQRARRLLLDADTTGFLLVLTPERLPVLESRRAFTALKRFGVPICGVVVNRVLPEGPLGAFLEERREQEAFYLRQIDEDFAGVPLARVALFPRDVSGLDQVREIARHLLVA